MTKAALFISLLIVTQAHPSSAQDRFFDSNGVRIRYVERGTGQPIVLVHGILGTIESNWEQTGVLANLSRDHRVIAFDMRGHGRSDKPHDPALYGREMASDIIRLLDHLKIEKAHLVGYSLGAFVTGLAVTMHPERFLTVTFGGESPFMGEWTAQTLKRTEQAAKEYEDGNLRSLMIGSAPRGAPPSDEEIRLRSERSLTGQDRLAIAAVRRSYGAFAVTETQFISLPMPLLGVAGSDDPNLRDVQYLKTLRPDMNVVVIDGATHNAPRNARARPEFIEAIRQFVNAHPSQRLMGDVQ